MKSEETCEAPVFFLSAGFIDCHIHAPQYSYTGNGLDLPLMQWLETYTFPAEARMEAFTEPPIFPLPALPILL